MKADQLRPGMVVKIMSKSGSRGILIAPIMKLDKLEGTVTVKDFLGNVKDYPLAQVRKL